MMEDHKYPTYAEARAQLIDRGFTETRRGWLNGLGKIATIVDRKDEYRGKARHFTIYVTDCDANERPF